MSENKTSRKLAQTSSDPSELMELALSTDTGIRYEVALNPNTPNEALSILANDSVESVAKAANAWIKVRGQSSQENIPVADQVTQISNSFQSKRLGFDERDEIAGLQTSGTASIFLGILLFVMGLLIGIPQLNTYGGIPIPFFVIATVGLVMINTGALFVVLAKLGSGIAYRIGRHLAIRIPNEELDSTYSNDKASLGLGNNQKPSGDVIQCRSCNEWIPRIDDSGVPQESCPNCGAGSAYLN